MVACRTFMPTLRNKRTSPRPVTARPPSPRAVAGWILRRPETLGEAEQLQLKTVRAHCPELDALTRHVRSFATMLTERQANACRTGSPPSGRTTCPASAHSPPASTTTATRSPPASPCPGAQVRSKGMSTTESRCSSARCSAAQASNSSESAPYWRDG